MNEKPEKKKLTWYDKLILLFMGLIFILAIAVKISEHMTQTVYAAEIHPYPPSYTVYQPPLLVPYEAIVQMFELFTADAARSELREAIIEAESRNQANYTNESWRWKQNVLIGAIYWYNDPTATSAHFQQMARQLQVAINSLEPLLPSEATQLQNIKQILEASYETQMWSIGIKSFNLGLSVVLIIAVIWSRAT